MAVLPIAWSVDIAFTPKNRDLYDYPAWKDLGIADGTRYCLKLILKPRSKRNVSDGCAKYFRAELERFNVLNASNICGSISIYETNTHKRFAMKAFQHSFKEGEKSFIFEVIFLREGHYHHAFSDINVHGHISIDLVTPDDPKAHEDRSKDAFISICPVPEIHQSFHQLSDNFQCMLKDPSFSDIILRCGAVKILAHKNVLSARSPVFKAMFQNNMKESRAAEIVITDVNPKTLQAMLNYMYCAKTDDFSDAVAGDLLYAADKYELLELKKKCVSYLESKISNANVFRVLLMAVLHDEHLKLRIFDYIGENFTVIETTKDWKLLKKKEPSLVMEILSWIVKFGK